MEGNNALFLGYKLEIYPLCYTTPPPCNEGISDMRVDFSCGTP